MNENLKCSGLSAGYGRMIVNRDVDLEVAEGSFAAVLGPNGAGKSTLLRGIAGMNQKGGRVFLGDRDLSRLPAPARARAGIAFVPESRGNIFPSMTVDENLAIASRRLGAQRDRELSELVLSLFPILADYSAKAAGLLSGGEQQMLAIGMALVSDPKIILLDEPSQGLAPSVLKKIETSLKSLKASGITVLLAEQNQRFALSLADEIYEIRDGELRSVEAAGAGAVG